MVGCVSDPHGYPSDAYIEGRALGHQLEVARFRAETARLEASNSEALLQAVGQLAGTWRHLGLPAEEADAIASEFAWSSGQSAINSRAKREGARTTVAAAVDAYRGHQYLLANQLLYAATREGVPSP